MMNTFRMKEKESVEAYKTRFYQKLILSGRETTKGDPDQLRQDQLLWFKTILWICSDSDDPNSFDEQDFFGTEEKSAKEKKSYDDGKRKWL